MKSVGNPINGFKGILKSKTKLLGYFLKNNLYFAFAETGLALVSK